jgi:hypothetical protein
VKKYLRVITETPYDSFTDYEELSPGQEGDDVLLASTAADMFHNRCNYGFTVVDESEVPKGDR